MNKLTKEQAAWLIETLKESRIRMNDYQRMHLQIEENVISIGAMEEVINQCTEKEFPILIQRTTTESFTIEPSSHVNYIAFGHGALSCKLSLEQFKEFADGVNKIVEYLNEVE